MGKSNLPETQTNIAGGLELGSERQRKAVDAEAKSGAWLIKANIAEESGKHETAEKYLLKSAYWLGVANKLRGDA